MRSGGSRCSLGDVMVCSVPLWIFGIALAWLGAGEVPAASVLTGGALVIGALLLNELVGWRERA